MLFWFLISKQEHQSDKTKSRSVKIDKHTDRKIQKHTEIMPDWLKEDDTDK